MNSFQAIDAYKNVNTQSGVTDASPHQLIAMLFSGALDRIASAKGAMARGDTGVQGTQIGKAISIIDGLRASLDTTRGGSVAANLKDLYDYMERRLLEGGARADSDALDEVTRLLREIKSGWDDIPAAERGAG
ncbi:MAG: flagellar export chaperone FliS [Pseudomonadota bacterium]